MHSSADGLASAPHDPSPTGASRTLPDASHGAADALHDPSSAPHGGSTNAPDNPSPPAALPDLSTAANGPSIPVGAQHSSIDAPRGSSTPVGLHYAPPLPSDTVNHTQHLVDTSLQPPAGLTQQAQMDHYALARYSSVGKINDKSLDERVYFNSEIANGVRTHTVQIIEVLHGKPTQYHCLAGCMNDRGKNKHTNVFQIAVGQGWQAVFEHCCSERHFKSICTNDSNPAAQQNRHDMQTVVNRYKAEVVPFSSRCAQNVRKIASNLELRGNAQ
jgi:hypothetical protein